jgi:predicted metal-dependent hydrolase
VLFNDQHFFEAHEVWEKAWRAEKGPTRPLLQGLIQVAAGYHKALVAKNAAGAVKLLEMGLEMLNPFPQPCLGLSLEPLREQVRVDLAGARAWLERRGPAPLEKGPALERLEP